MKALVLIDSFKGTLTSLEAGNIVKEEFEKKDIDTRVIGISDGGEGFLDAISQNMVCEKKELTVSNPFGEKIKTYYLVNEKQAYIEMAKACGFLSVKREEKNILWSTSYGLGEIIKDAYQNGYEDIIVGIGGTLTNDGGIGALEALGVKFYDKEHQLLQDLRSKDLLKIKVIDDSILEKYTGLRFNVVCDVRNPLLGEKGATYVYGPQKGGNKENLKRIESGMKNYSQVIKKNSVDVNYPGSGAAGGVGFMLHTFFNAKFVEGIKYILQKIQFSKLKSTYDLFVLGEGKLDESSLNGKVVFEILKEIKEKRVIVVCGKNELGDIAENVAVYAIVPNITSFEDSMMHPKEALEKLVKEIIKTYKF